MESLTSQNHSTNSNGGKGSLLLEMKNIWIEGFSDERWHEIIKGVNLTLNRGEILGLIGEVGCRKIDSWTGCLGFCKTGLQDHPGGDCF